MAKNNALQSFPLKGFVPPVKNSCHVEKMMSPEPDFQPEGNWNHQYLMYSLAGRGSSYGEVAIRRKTKGEAINFSVAYRKRTSADPVHVMDAEIAIKGDTLATPVHWEFESYIQLPPEKAMEETRLSKKGLCDSKGMKIETRGVSYRLEADGPYAINWALMEAVQRLPRKAGFETGFFTLFDHFDQSKPEQQIRFWETVNLALPDGREMQLHCLEQVGRGILPIYYYVSDQGQLMAVISGVEGYLLTGTKEA